MKKWLISSIVVVLIILLSWTSIRYYQSKYHDCINELLAELRTLREQLSEAEYYAAFVPADSLVTQHKTLRYLALCVLYNDAVNTLGRPDLYHPIIGNNVKVYELRTFFSIVTDELKYYPLVRSFILYNGHWPMLYVLGIRTT